jgi:riboflavin transporter FmnP
VPDSADSARCTHGFLPRIHFHCSYIVYFKVYLSCMPLLCNWPTVSCRNQQQQQLFIMHQQLHYLQYLLFSAGTAVDQFLKAIMLIIIIHDELYIKCTNCCRPTFVVGYIIQSVIFDAIKIVHNYAKASLIILCIGLVLPTI